MRPRCYYQGDTSPSPARPHQKTPAPKAGGRRNYASLTIPIFLFRIIGLDGHTTGIFDEVFSFVREVELYEVQVTLLTPFPGTPLYTRLEQEDRLLEPRNWKKCTLFDINFKPTHMSVQELHEGFKKLAVELYSEEFTNWRRSHFKRAIRDRRRPQEVQT